MHLGIQYDGRLEEIGHLRVLEHVDSADPWSWSIITPYWPSSMRCSLP